jgi:hypothetical protein
MLSDWKTDFLFTHHAHLRMEEEAEELAAAEAAAAAE